MELDTTLAAEPWPRRLAGCIDRVKQMQTERPESFECLAACMKDVASLAEVQACDRCDEAERLRAAGAGR